MRKGLNGIRRLDERAVTHMEEVFQRTQNPPMDEKLRIAEMFGLTKTQVIGWFTHQRTKMRKGLNGPWSTGLIRRRLAKRAVTHMRGVFQKTPNPPMDKMVRIAEMFGGITKKEVIDWFHHERRKMKKSKESH